MDVLIKNMDKPRICRECEINDDGWCQLVEDSVGWDSLYERCPLIEVPPHGRLGDLDEIMPKLKKIFCTGCPVLKRNERCEDCMIADFYELLEDAPTVLEAST